MMGAEMAIWPLTEERCMPDMSRRELFEKAAMSAAVAGFLAARGSDLRANPLGLPIGSQTWPHRAMIKQDFPGTLKQLADIGVQGIELCSPFGYAEFAGLTNGAEVRKVVTDHGLKCESAHFGMKELRETQAKSIAWAADVGITQMITATLGAGSTPTMDDVKRAADEYNKIAAVAAKAGMRQGLHNEGFEISMVDGKRTYDVLFGLLDPALVKFQFQMSTIRDGFDAAEYFTKYPGRFYSMHLQDWNPDTKTVVAVGQGSIDWKKVFAAAKTGGVKNYFVEQNMDMTKAGVTFLKRLDV
jgi:sugar phosphate isomerase/epimerase